MRCEIGKVKKLSLRKRTLIVTMDIVRYLFGVERTARGREERRWWSGGNPRVREDASGHGD